MPPKRGVLDTPQLLLGGRRSLAVGTEGAPGGSGKAAPFPAAPMVTAMLAQLRFFFPLWGQASVGPRPVHDTQWATPSGRRTSRSLRSPLRTFSFLPPAQLCTKLVAFSGDLFGVGKDLEIAFPEAWEANSHLALTAGA